MTGGDPPPAAVKRRGKSQQKLDHDKVHEYTCVQVKLSTAFQSPHQDDLELAQVIHNINDVLQTSMFNLSKIALEAYIFANIYVLVR
jgi:hypothetical protein